MIKTAAGILVLLLLLFCNFAYRIKNKTHTEDCQKKSSIFV